MATTNTQLFKAINELKDAKDNMCPADRKTYEAHCKILAELGVTLPTLKNTLEKLDKKLDTVEKDLTVLKTERHVLLGLAGFIAGIVAWLVKQL